MRSSVALLAVALATLCSPIPASASAPAPTPTERAVGLHVADGRLYEANGAEFVMRGVNHAHTWYRGETGSFADIKALGANTVRVVLSSGDQWTENDAADVAAVVGLCKQNRLICVLEVHDTTGYGEQAAAVSLARAVDYWLRVRSALVGQERYVVVNIGNEPFGNTNVAAWTQDTIDAIGRLRAAGFEHALMVDAPNWGQDWSFTMRDNAARVLAEDPAGNTVFSVHMYGVFDTAAEISDYLGRFVSAGLPILVGEFGHDHSDGNPDEDAILATTQRLGLGYLGWSWSGNGGGVEYLDMATSFDPARLTSWGRRIFDGTNGIRATAREATVYGGGDTTPPTAPGTPTASGTTATGTTLSWTAATDDTGVTGYDVVRVSGPTETPAATTTTTTVALTGLSPGTAYTFAVYARDAAGNRSPRSATVPVTTRPGGTGACTAAYRVTGQWPGGFQAEVTVTNAAADAVEGWSLRWAYPGGQVVTAMWHATAAQSGTGVTATDVGYNRVIPAGGSVTIGLTGTYATANPAPTAFTLNGTACGV